LAANLAGAYAQSYLDRIGVADPPPLLTPFDPGYDPLTVAAHLEQSAHLMAGLKISMACWMIAAPEATRRKVEAAQANGVPAVAGGGPFEIAVEQDELSAYLDLCAETGFARIECAEGFTEKRLSPPEVIRQAGERGLEAQFELGSKHGGPFATGTVDGLVKRGQEWLDAGAKELIVEARESAAGVGLFDDAGNFNGALADRFAAAFGLDQVSFEAPNKPSQFALLDHFGPSVRLCNVRLEEVLRVEIYRRGLHSDAFSREGLRPRRPADARAESR
jgi:phosphosulfolactate synthase